MLGHQEAKDVSIKLSHYEIWPLAQINKYIWYMYVHINKARDRYT